MFTTSLIKIYYVVDWMKHMDRHKYFSQFKIIFYLSEIYKSMDIYAMGTFLQLNM
jgi:hypothetical protein